MWRRNFRFLSGENVKGARFQPNFLSVYTCLALLNFKEEEYREYNAQWQMLKASGISEGDVYKQILNHDSSWSMQHDYSSARKIW